MDPVVLTEHAVERYRERVKPAFTLAQARQELQRCLETIAVMQPMAPEWIWKLPEGVELDPELRAGFEVCAMIGDDIAVPLARHGRRLFAVSCMTRAGLPEGARAWRNRHRRAVKARRRRLREKHHERALAKRAKRSGEPRRDAA